MPLLDKRSQVPVPQTLNASSTRSEPNASSTQKKHLPHTTTIKCLKAETESKACLPQTQSNACFTQIKSRNQMCALHKHNQMPTLHTSTKSSAWKSDTVRLLRTAEASKISQKTYLQTSQTSGDVIMHKTVLWGTSHRVWNENCTTQSPANEHHL